MNLPSLKAFISPRNNFFVMEASNDDQFKSSKSKTTNKDKYLLIFMIFGYNKLFAITLLHNIIDNID